MLTHIDPKYKNTGSGKRAEKIIRRCVHCGFCNATCPTYLELGDERDGPRGRIYLIKAMLEGDEVTDKTRKHLDRCLTCSNCETTCPSNVEYGELIDIGREIIEQEQVRPFRERWLRQVIRQILPYPKRFSFLLKTGQLFRALLPAALKQKIPEKVKTLARPYTRHNRFIIALAGCVQPSATPNTNIAAAIVLDRLGISLLEVPESGCCGAVDQHLGKPGPAKQFMKQNIDAWWPDIERGAEAIVSLASGCGTMLKNYGRCLRNDPEYAEKAGRVSELVCDIGDILLREDLTPLKPVVEQKRIAVHCPCTLQHGLKKPELPRAVLQKFGFNLVKTADNHLCCGSAGTYSILQPEMSQRLLDNKLAALTVNQPEIIVTANVGCQLHLQSKSSVPVKHWIELLVHHFNEIDGCRRLGGAQAIPNKPVRSTGKT